MSASRTRAILALTGKDLRLLSRNRATLFFALGWPILMALFFGYVFGGGGRRGRSRWWSSTRTTPGSRSG
jgi:hypothetical protein